MGLLNLTGNYISIDDSNKKEFNRIWYKYYRRIWLFSKSMLKAGNTAVDDINNDRLKKYAIKAVEDFKSGDCIEL